MFASSIYLIMMIWNYNSLDGFLISHLFKMRPEETEQMVLKDQKLREDEAFKAPNMPYFKDIALSVVPERLVCCKKPREKIGRGLASDILADEMNVVDLVRK